MAHTEKLIPVPVEAVHAVLSDPTAYGHFVVGTKEVRRFDPRWPEPGATFHHSVGAGPLVLRDKTDSTRHDPPEGLAVRPHIRPFVVLETVFALEARGEETLLRLDEYAVGGWLRPVWPGPLDGLLGLRNRLVVERIAHLAEQRWAALDGMENDRAPT
jgi:hypothetical protein